MTDTLADTADTADTADVRPLTPEDKGYKMALIASLCSGLASYLSLIHI